MKKKVLLTICATAVLMAASCSDDNGVKNEDITDKAYQEIIDQYLTATIAPTYRNLSANAEVLVERLEDFRDSRTDAALAAACESFLEARAWWERSEAFLFGPAGDFGIDPHIDSWPLDRAALDTQLANTAQLAFMAGDDGDVWAGSHLGPELLGFHGIEYIIFADGQPRKSAQVTDAEITYAIAIAGDLRNKVWQLELSWIGEDAAEDAIVEKIADLEWPCTVAGTSYAQNMRRAGSAGSVYRSFADAVQAIADGCATIADEVGASKIGKPHSGEDPNYIESPYSHKSITDFHDNMVSIENAYMGGIEGRRNEARSLHAHIKSIDSDLDSRCVAAIAEAKAKINAMKAPFVNNYTDASADAAAQACLALQEILLEVKAQL